MQRREDKLLLPLMIGAIVLGRRAGVRYRAVLRDASGCSCRSASSSALLAAVSIFGRRVQKPSTPRPTASPAPRAGRWTTCAAPGGSPRARGHHPARRRAPGDRPSRRDPRGRGRAAPGEVAARAGEEAHVTRRGQHPDLRLHRGQRRGPDPAARSPEDAHQAPAQHLDQPDGRRSRRASPRWARAPRRCRRARCPRARRCAASSARCGGADALTRAGAHHHGAALARSCQPRPSTSRTSGGDHHRDQRRAAGAPRPHPDAGAAVDGSHPQPERRHPGARAERRDRHGREDEPDTEDEPPEPGVDRGVGSGEYRGDASR